MDTRYLTRMKKTSSMGQFTQQKTLIGDQQSKTILAYSDLHIPPRQLISGSIQKKEYYTPTPNKMKVFDKQIFPRLNVVSNGDPSSNSISISLESSETPEKRIVGNQQKNKNVSKVEVKNVIQNIERKNSLLKESQKDQYSSNPQIYEDQINQSRKSYRKNYQRRLNIIPFRKCQSLIEERIVNVINKMEGGKECEKELRSLNQKLRKLPMRELMNRFVVSGVHVVRKLAEKEEIKQRISTDFSQLFWQTSKLMEQRILFELDNIESFQSVSEEIQNEQVSDLKIEKSTIVRKAYKILKRKKKISEKQKIRDECLKVTQNFFQYSPLNIENLIQAFSEKNIQI